MQSTSLFEPGRNVWRVARASRAAFLVDGAAYYTALASAIERAERSILLVGWDIDSRTRLCRKGRPTETICELLNRVVSAKRGLHVNLLAWDFAMVYALERQFFPLYHLGWKTHRRVHFRLDSDHPLGASHHQKVVVIDDKIAFSGGLDVTTRRWDTRKHAPDDPQRKDPDDELYKPFHDIQIAVDGEAARALGDLLRERWRRASGKHLKPPTGIKGDPWPEDLRPDITDVDVGIARTEPSLGERPEVREVERLFLDSIARAKKSIYIENQYTTSTTLSEALAARLSEPGGPEIVIVCPKMCSGWLECQTMGVLRAGFLDRLMKADREGRLRLYYPRVSEDVDVFVHSKVLVVDGEIVRIGSANLSNRSMRVDTECDVTIEARGQERVEKAITRFRDQLLGEHLGQKPADVTAAIDANGGSLIRGIEALRTGERTLAPMELQVEAAMESDAIVQLAADPERPIDPEQFVNTFLFEDEAALKGRLRRRAAAMAVVIAALILLWTLTPLREYVSPAEISHAITGLRASPIAPFLMMGVFAIGTLLMIPVNVLILATGLTFGPLLGVIYSVLGVLAGASAGYVTGRALGRETLRRISSSRINKLSLRLAKSGVLAIAAARIVPVAPFGVVNLVAGASYIHYRQFVIGTFIGNLPGIVLMTVFGPEALRAIIAGSPSRWLVVAGILVAVALVGGAFAWIRRRDARPEPRYPELRTTNAGAD